jgi:hypothetical protein
MAGKRGKVKGERGKGKGERGKDKGKRIKGKKTGLSQRAQRKRKAERRSLQSNRFFALSFSY